VFVGFTWFSVFLIFLYFGVLGGFDAFVDFGVLSLCSAFWCFVIRWIFLVDCGVSG